MEASDGSIRRRMPLFAKEKLLEQKIKKEKKNKPEPTTARRVWRAVGVGVIYLLAVSFVVAGLYYKANFNMAFGEVLYTILSPLGGTGVGTVEQILEPCLPPILVFLLGYVGLVILLWDKGRVWHILRLTGTWLCVAGLLSSVIYAAFSFRIPEYIQGSAGKTDLYEQYYVDPNQVAITADGKTKNLIYIYVESLETTYASAEDGGAQAINYMPRLTALARENVSFSGGKKLGGFHSIAGTGWTMGALFGTTSGVPFSLAVFGNKSHNAMGRDGKFANGLTTMGDILAARGYTQEFLLGSDRAFAGCSTYLGVHGDYRIYDHETAIEKGEIPEDYNVWWGFEDEILFRIAKKELLGLAAEGKPFNFTMQTIDLHHVGGYRCNRCGNQYDTTLKNAIDCNDRQITEFVEWCREQSFFEDTVIVITGDHPRMDSQLVNQTDFYDRTVYNCFINAASEPVKTQNRIATSLDIFPSVLAAMGFTVEGDRLGLGTNLFSDRPTLAEEKGYSWLEGEVGKYSDYYKKNFVKDRK